MYTERIMKMGGGAIGFRTSSSPGNVGGIGILVALKSLIFIFNLKNVKYNRCVEKSV